MTDPMEIGTFASEAERRAAFDAAVAQQQALDNEKLQPVWDSMVGPKPPVMTEINIQARKFPPYLLIGILLVGYLLFTGKGRSFDWE